MEVCLRAWARLKKDKCAGTYQVVAEMILALSFGTVMEAAKLFDRVLEDELGLDYETTRIGQIFC